MWKPLVCEPPEFSVKTAGRGLAFQGIYPEMFQQSESEGSLWLVDG